MPRKQTSSTFANWKDVSVVPMIYYETVDFENIPYKSRIGINAQNIAYLKDKKATATVWGMIETTPKGNVFVDLNENRYPMTGDQIVISETMGYAVVGLTSLKDKIFFKRKLGINKSPLKQYLETMKESGGLKPFILEDITVPLAVIFETEQYVNSFIAGKKKNKSSEISNSFGK